MKSVYLLKVRLWVFLTEIPLMLLLMICWSMNNEVEGLLKLYPLIIVLAAAIIFLPIYFFRAVSVSWEEINDIGLFTARDNALINKGKTLVIKLISRGRIKLTLWGHDGNYAGFDWMKPDDDDANRDIAMYRGNAYGGKRAVKALLSYFGASDEDVTRLLDGECDTLELAYTSLTAKRDDEGIEISIRMNATLLNTGAVVPEEE
ncbi:MAG: hypothetical protein IKC87_04180 [Clostridia bacterium]|nr:hypothetical protein [Clostridia bacterium]